MTLRYNNRRVCVFSLLRNCLNKKQPVVEDPETGLVGKFERSRVRARGPYKALKGLIWP